MAKYSFEIWIQLPTHLSVAFHYQVTFYWINAEQQLKPYV